MSVSFPAAHVTITRVIIHCVPISGHKWDVSINILISNGPGERLGVPHCFQDIQGP